MNIDPNASGDIWVEDRNPSRNDSHCPSDSRSQGRTFTRARSTTSRKSTRSRMGGRPFRYAPRCRERSPQRHIDYGHMDPPRIRDFTSGDSREVEQNTSSSYQVDQQNSVPKDYNEERPRRRFQEIYSVKRGKGEKKNRQLEVVARGREPSHHPTLKSDTLHPGNKGLKQLSGDKQRPAQHREQLLQTNIRCTATDTSQTDLRSPSKDRLRHNQDIVLPGQYRRDNTPAIESVKTSETTSRQRRYSDDTGSVNHKQHKRPSQNAGGLGRIFQLSIGQLLSQSPCTVPFALSGTHAPVSPFETYRGPKKEQGPTHQDGSGEVDSDVRVPTQSKSSDEQDISHDIVQHNPGSFPQKQSSRKNSHHKNRDPAARTNWETATLYRRSKERELEWVPCNETEETGVSLLTEEYSATSSISSREVPAVSEKLSKDPPYCDTNTPADQMGDFRPASLNNGTFVQKHVAGDIDVTDNHRNERFPHSTRRRSFTFESGGSEQMNNFIASGRANHVCVSESETSASLQETCGSPSNVVGGDGNSIRSSENWINSSSMNSTPFLTQSCTQGNMRKCMTCLSESLDNLTIGSEISDTEHVVECLFDTRKEICHRCASPMAGDEKREESMLKNRYHDKTRTCHAESKGKQIFHSISVSPPTGHGEAPCCAHISEEASVRSQPKAKVDIVRCESNPTATTEIEDRSDIPCNQSYHHQICQPTHFSPACHEEIYVGDAYQNISEISNYASSSVTDYHQNSIRSSENWVTHIEDLHPDPTPVSTAREVLGQTSSAVPLTPRKAQSGTQRKKKRLKKKRSNKKNLIDDSPESKSTPNRDMEKGKPQFHRTVAGPNSRIKKSLISMSDDFDSPAIAMTRTSNTADKVEASYNGPPVKDTSRERAEVDNIRGYHCPSHSNRRGVPVHRSDSADHRALLSKSLNHERRLTCASDSFENIQETLYLSTSDIFDDSEDSIVSSENWVMPRSDYPLVSDTSIQSNVSNKQSTLFCNCQITNRASNGTSCDFCGNVRRSPSPPCILCEQCQRQKTTTSALPEYPFTSTYFTCNQKQSNECFFYSSAFDPRGYGRPRSSWRRHFASRMRPTWQQNNWQSGPHKAGPESPEAAPTGDYGKGDWFGAKGIPYLPPPPPPPLHLLGPLIPSPKKNEDISRIGKRKALATDSTPKRRELYLENPDENYPDQNDYIHDNLCHDDKGGEGREECPQEQWSPSSNVTRGIKHDSSRKYAPQNPQRFAISQPHHTHTDQDRNRDSGFRHRDYYLPPPLPQNKCGDILECGSSETERPDSDEVGETEDWTQEQSSSAAVSEEPEDAPLQNLSRSVGFRKCSLDEEIDIFAMNLGMSPLYGNRSTQSPEESLHSEDESTDSLEHGSDVSAVLSVNEDDAEMLTEEFLPTKSQQQIQHKPKQKLQQQEESKQQLQQKGKQYLQQQQSRQQLQQQDSWQQLKQQESKWKLQQQLESKQQLHQQAPKKSMQQQLESKQQLQQQAPKNSMQQQLESKQQLQQEEPKKRMQQQLESKQQLQQQVPKKSMQQQLESKQQLQQQEPKKSMQQHQATKQQPQQQESTKQQLQRQESKQQLKRQDESKHKLQKQHESKQQLQQQESNLKFERESKQRLHQHQGNKVQHQKQLQQPQDLQRKPKRQEQDEAVAEAQVSWMSDLKQEKCSLGRKELCQSGEQVVLKQESSTQLSICETHDHMDITLSTDGTMECRNIGSDDQCPTSEDKKADVKIEILKPARIEPVVVPLPPNKPEEMESTEEYDWFSNPPPEGQDLPRKAAPPTTQQHTFATPKGQTLSSRGRKSVDNASIHSFLTGPMLKSLRCTDASFREKISITPSPNMWNVLSSLDNNSTTSDSDSSPKLLLKPRVRKSRWSDPPKPTTSLLLDEDTVWQKRFRDRFNDLKTVYFDTHCHIDFLLKRSGIDGSFEQYQELNKGTFPDSYAGCLTVFCDPRTFRKQGKWRNILQNPMVWGAVGCHPKSATDFDGNAERNLKDMIKHDKIVALGEIGLDYSGTFRQHEAAQKNAFEKQIHIAVDNNMPLVIHCRDAEADCVEILTKIVPRNHRIHRHCFTGTWDEAEIWLQNFPNSYIGLTPLITYMGGRAYSPREVAKKMPLDRLLLETDAPYFVPRMVPRDAMSWSHPGMAITVAVEVAKLRGIDIEEVLQQCLQNTETMYGIKVHRRDSPISTGAVPQE